MAKRPRHPAVPPPPATRPMPTPAQVIDRNQPWLPCKAELPDVAALQALQRGDATDEQQKRALKWVIESAAATYQPSYRPGADGDRQTVFAEGRRYVGLRMIELLRANLNAWRDNDVSES